MTEAQVGLLYKIASNYSRLENNGMQTLKSYYLMRCKVLTRGYGLPEKHFSYKVRCPYCCLEWTKDSETKVKPVKLSKRQKKRIKSLKISNKNKTYVESRKALLHSNQIEQICGFCKHITITPILKPIDVNKEMNIKKESMDAVTVAEVKHNNSKKSESNNKKNKTKVNTATNVYSNAFDVFSLKNKNNTLISTIKEPPKVIKNNKRKKDKFAGLCQKAVLASSKMKMGNEKQNKLNLFLKPSS